MDTGETDSAKATGHLESHGTGYLGYPKSDQKHRDTDKNESDRHSQGDTAESLNGRP